VVGGQLDSHDERVRAQQEILRRQEEELQRQRREIENLKRQQEYNDSFKVYERPKGEREKTRDRKDRDDSFAY
jgi:hypothetical protein